MNYNALLLLDKNRKYRNSYSINISNFNQFSFSNQKIINNLNIRTNENQKYKKCYSVKPSLYMMPKDIILKDIFHTSIKSSKEYIKKFESYNTNIRDVDRKYIFKKIKKFILINHINYKVFAKTIFLYDFLLFEREKASKNKKFSNFSEMQNLSVALIAFILSLKFNYEENKMISLKKFVKNFEERNENITFNEVCEMEIVALQLINYNLTFQTPFSYMELFLINGIIFNDDYISSELSFNLYELVNETLENIMVTSNDYFKYNYFYLCCSTIMYIRDKFKIVRWPKALEITFGAYYEQFYDIYNNFFSKNNKKDNTGLNNYNNNNKNNIKSLYSSDIINLSNLKSMTSIISVLKIIKSADKYKRTKEKINKIELFNNKNDKEENCKDNNNNNINENYSNKIKVGLKKKWNFSTFKSPGKFNISKASISSVVGQLKEEKKSIFSDYKNTENNNKENEDINNSKKSNSDSKNKNEESIQMKNTNSGEIMSKENINNMREKTKINITKSCNRYKKSTLIINKNNPENYNPKTNKFSNNYNNINNNINTNNISNLDNTLNINIYKKRNYIDKKGTDLFKSCPEINKEIKNNNIHSSKINPISYKYNNINNKINNRYFNNFTEKKRNLELNNNNNNLNVNQTSFNDFLFYKNKLKNQNSNNDIDKENYLDKFKLKNKEENSNALTCESSNVKVSLNDFSIRKSYRYKKKYTKNESTKEEKLDLSPKNERNKKEVRKVLEKNKSFNKLLNNKIPFSDNTYNRKTGVRKYYKQKNSREYH